MKKEEIEANITKMKITSDFFQKTKAAEII